MGERVNNMGKLMNNPKQRNIYFLSIGAVVVLVGAGLYFASKNNTPQGSSGASITSAPTVNVIPGSSTNPEYNKTVIKSNQDDANKALNNGGSFVPVLTNDKSITDKSMIDEIERQRKIDDEKNRIAAEKSKAEQDALRMEDEKARAALVQPTMPVNTVSATTVTTQTMVAPVKREKYSADDALLISTLSGAWHTKSSSAEFDYAKQKANNEVAASSSSNNAQSATTAASANAVVPYAKAGTIFNAILESSIDSDEPSPVLARIVSGDLKGTRLIGSVQTVGEKVLIQFTTANIPQLGSSVKLSSYAVDPNTSRTALADNVNHHYILKYGVLLASSFLGGYADAISRQNTTTTQGLLGPIVTQGELSTSQINKAALGGVGKAVASDAQQQFTNLKPTITVNSGAPIGILLVDDLVIKN